MTPEPTPLITVLPCEAEKARDILQRERGSALWLNDDEVIRAMVRFAHDARLAALEAAAKVAEAMYVKDAFRFEFGNDIATAIRALSNKTGEGSGETSLADAVRELLAGMKSTYTARNGREIGIEADDGEKCWIVHSDLIAALEGALAASNKGGRDGE